MEPQLSFEEALLKVATSQTGVLIASGRDENPVGWKAIYDFVEQANLVASVVNPNLVAFYIAYHDTQSGNTIWSMDMSLRVTLLRHHGHPLTRDEAENWRNGHGDCDHEVGIYNCHRSCYG